MRRFFGSIRFRIVAIYVSVMVLAFLAVSAIASAIVQSFLVTQRVQEQTGYTERLSIELLPLWEQQDIYALYESAVAHTRSNSGRILLLDTDAVVQLDTASEYNGTQFASREVRDILVNGYHSSYGFHKLAKPDSTRGDAEWVVYYTASVQMENAQNTMLGVVLYVVSIQDVQDSVNDVTRQIGLVFVVMAMIVGFISLMVSGWLTKPIITLTNAIRRVGAKGYGERVPVHGKDELAQLSEAFNIMSEKLESHDRVRNEFVSNASHELKTPLASIKILSETMLYQDNPDPQMAKEFFQDIDHEIDRLNHIINDLLRLVREENVTEALNFEKVELNTLLNDVIRRLLPIAKQKGIRLERKLIGVTVEGDGPRLTQVFSNLIDNAIKYTDKGSVSVTLKPDGNYAVVAVRDTGIGVPKEEIPRLFERFYRVDKARSRDTGGTGLGLSIVERIVTMHGGYIHVESVLGRGTTFTVRLPLVQKAASPGQKGGLS